MLTRNNESLFLPFFFSQNRRSAVKRTTKKDDTQKATERSQYDFRIEMTLIV